MKKDVNAEEAILLASSNSAIADYLVKRGKKSGRGLTRFFCARPASRRLIFQSIGVRFPRRSSKPRKSARTTSLIMTSSAKGS